MEGRRVHSAAPSWLAAACGQLGVPELLATLLRTAAWMVSLRGPQALAVARAVG